MVSTQLCFIHKYTQAFHLKTGLINNHADGGENHPEGKSDVCGQSIISLEMLIHLVFLSFSSLKAYIFKLTVFSIQEICDKLQEKENKHVSISNMTCRQIDCDEIIACGYTMLSMLETFCYCKYVFIIF